MIPTVVILGAILLVALFLVREGECTICPER